MQFFKKLYRIQLYLSVLYQIIKYNLKIKYACFKFRI